MNQAFNTSVQHVSSGTGLVHLPLGSVLVLVLVLVLFLAIVWLYRRMGLYPRMKRGAHILTVKFSQSLGARERLVVVEIDNKWLLLGVTHENISCLITMDKQDSSIPTSPTEPFSRVLLESLMKRQSGSRK